MESIHEDSFHEIYTANVTPSQTDDTVDEQQFLDESLSALVLNVSFSLDADNNNETKTNEFVAEDSVSLKLAEKLEGQFLDSYPPHPYRDAESKSSSSPTGSQKQEPCELLENKNDEYPQTPNLARDDIKESLNAVQTSVSKNIKKNTILANIFKSGGRGLNRTESPNAEASDRKFGFSMREAVERISAIEPPPAWKKALERNVVDWCAFRTLVSRRDNHQSPRRDDKSVENYSPTVVKRKMVETIDPAAIIPTTNTNIHPTIQPNESRYAHDAITSVDVDVSTLKTTTDVLNIGGSVNTVFNRVEHHSVDHDEIDLNAASNEANTRQSFYVVTNIVVFSCLACCPPVPVSIVLLLAALSNIAIDIYFNYAFNCIDF